MVQMNWRTHTPTHLFPYWTKLCGAGNKGRTVAHGGEK